MKVLVTGGLGFIGSHVAEYYARLGCEVICYDNSSRSILLKDFTIENYNSEYLRRYENIFQVHYDILDTEKIKEAALDVDVIVHAAAQTAVTTSLRDPFLDFRNNAQGTLNVLEAARISNNNPTIIFCSTNKVYGNNVNRISIKEEDLKYSFTDPFYQEGIPETFSIDNCEHTPYGCSKLAADLYAQDYGHLYGMKVGVFRMSCIYGMRQQGVADQGWVSWFTKACIEKLPVTLFGDGKQVRDILYITDLVKAFDAFIVNLNLKQEIFNMGGGSKNTVSLIELINLLESLSGNKMIINFSNWRPSDQKVYISNIQKAKHTLKWEPKISPTEGIAKLFYSMKNPSLDEFYEPKNLNSTPSLQ